MLEELMAQVVACLLPKALSTLGNKFDKKGD